MAKLLLTLLFVLDGVGKLELDAFNRRQVHTVHLCLSRSANSVHNLPKFCAKQIRECAFSVLMSVRGVHMFCV